MAGRGTDGPGTTPPGRARPGPARSGRGRPGPVPPGISPGRTGSHAMRLFRATWAIVVLAVAGGAFALLFAAWRQSAAGPVGAGQWVVAAVVGVLALGSW